MAVFEVVREVQFGPRQAWNRLTDWQRHARFVPLTSITLTPQGFDAFTGVGPIGFHDPMDVVEQRAPEWCRLVKRGRVIRGWAELTIEPVVSGSRVTWREDIHVRGVPRLFDSVTRLAGRRLFARVVDGLMS